jgi:hypothetical protein
MKIKKQYNSQEEHNTYIQQKHKFKEYVKNVRNLKKFIMTTRFNNSTFYENIQYRNSHKIGCIYCSPQPVSANIASESIMFVLEMNNDENQITGIGMVKNHPIVGKYFVYDKGNYNRYVFIGKHRIDRKEMSEQEEEIMKAFDILCFKGDTHLKRGQGLRTFPLTMLFNCQSIMNLIDFITNMFKKRMQQNNYHNKSKQT